MDDELRNQIKNKLPEILKHYGATPPKNEKGNWNCIPGRHSNNKSDLSVKGDICCCHCGLKGDAFSVIQEIEGLTKFPLIAEKAIAILGMSNETIKPLAIKEKPKEAGEPKQAYKIDIDKYHAKVSETDYFCKRGLTKKTIDKYKLGFNTNDTHPYYLPVNDTYVIRRAGAGVEPRYSNPKAKNAEVLNLGYITDNTKQIFIVEGFIDALSIEETGNKAISLNSTENNRILLEKIEKHVDQAKTKTFIFVPDNDSKGIGLIPVMQEAFKGLKVPLEVVELPKQYKDSNEYLATDSEGFKAFIDGKLNDLLYSDYVLSYLPDFLKDIKKNKDKPIISTGFLQFNKKLNGGIIPGMYCVGGISSLGKTALALQIADYIAKSGNDVIFFSLEMSKLELVSRSISRELININRDKYRSYGTTVISRGQFGQDDLKDISKALKNYEKTAKHLIIHEGNFETGIDEIRQKVQAHINKTGRLPVVFVDYLQVIKGRGQGSEKQEVDYIAVELKRISRDFDIPVIVVSSFNRGSYTSPVSYESFKESGAIEYTSDVLIGLQLTKVRELEQSEKKKAENRSQLDQAKNEIPRRVTVVTLKQRNGQAYATHDFLFFPVNNLFQEVDAR